MTRYVVITGGELFNKGAQAMTFVTVEAMSQRFPDHQIVLLSSEDAARPEAEKQRYRFAFLPLDMGLAYELLGGLKRTLWRLKARRSGRQVDPGQVRQLHQLFSQTDLMVDISGYALSSQWGWRATLSYLSRIELGRHYGFKVYLMPQSFGPFEYPFPQSWLLHRMLAQTLAYPEVIHAREQEGYDLLTQRYGLTNVKLTRDLVLLTPAPDLQAVYHTPPALRRFPEAGGVAIIPNMRNFDHGDRQQIEKLYGTLIDQLLERGQCVYLVRHSHEDLAACEAIKAFYPDHAQVILLGEDLNCAEFDQLVRQFDFVIASRFHAIVHAYKNGVPALVLGWATKYHELLALFDQRACLFDVRQSLDTGAILAASAHLLASYAEVSQTIRQRLSRLQGRALFDIECG